MNELTIIQKAILTDLLKVVVAIQRESELDENFERFIYELDIFEDYVNRAKIESILRDNILPVQF